MGRAAGPTLPPATLAAWGAFAGAMLHAVWLVRSGPVPRIAAANDSAGALVRLDAAALIGRPALELLASPEDEAFWNDVAAGRAAEIESDTLQIGRASCRERV